MLTPGGLEPDGGAEWGAAADPSDDEERSGSSRSGSEWFGVDIVRDNGRWRMVLLFCPLVCLRSHAREALVLFIIYFFPLAVI